MHRTGCTKRITAGVISRATFGRISHSLGLLPSRVMKVHPQYLQSKTRICTVHTHTYTSTCWYIYVHGCLIYINTYICVCMCMNKYIQYTLCTIHTYVWIGAARCNVVAYRFSTAGSVHVQWYSHSPGHRMPPVDPPGGQRLARG